MPWGIDGRGMGRGSLAVTRMGPGLLAALWALSPIAGAHTAVAPSLCTRLATQLRRSPALVARDMRQPRRWLQPWVMFANPQSVKKAALGPRVLAQLRAPMGSMGPESLERLPAFGLMLVSGNDVDSFGYCSRGFPTELAMYVKSRRDTVPEVLPLPSLDLMPCRSRQGWRSLATVLGEPAAIQSEALDTTRSDTRLRVQPWLGKRWGPSCSVAIRFTYRSKIARQLYCGAHRAVCTAAREIAPALERRYQLYLVNAVEAVTYHLGTPRIHFGDSLRAHARVLIGRARRVATVQALAAARTAKPAGLAHLRLKYVEYFPLRLNGTAYLGAIAPIAYGNRVLFGVYRVPRAHSARLAPVAVFRLRWQVAHVKSIRVRDQPAARKAR